MSPFEHLKYFGISALHRIIDLFFRKDYFDRYHVEVSVEGLSFKLHWLHHEEYALLKQKEITELQTSVMPTEFISVALHAAKSCNYLTFECSDDGRFVQFWLGDGDVKVSWPVIPGKNKMGKYVYPMLGVLNELNITQELNNTGTFYRAQYQYYQLKLDEGFENYELHFANDYNLAAEFANKVFTKVFKQDLKQLRFELG